MIIGRIWSIWQVFLELVNLISDPSENKVLQVMAEQRNLAMFTEKILLLVNREGTTEGIHRFLIFIFKRSSGLQNWF